MQTENFGDFAQHHRPHRHLAVLEEMALAVDDRLRYAQDCLEPLLDVADQPFRFLQLRGKLLVRSLTIASEDVGVDAVQPQLGHRCLVERRHPPSPELPYDHVRDHIVRLGLGKAGAGARVEACDQRAHAAQAGVVRV